MRACRTSSLSAVALVCVRVALVLSQLLHWYPPSPLPNSYVPNSYVTYGFVTAAKATSLSLQFTTELGALQGLLVGTFGY